MCDLPRIEQIVKLIPNNYSNTRSSHLIHSLEIGTGYGSLVRSLARIFDNVNWHGIEHPERAYVKKENYWQFCKELNIELKLCDIVKNTLPFEDNYFRLIIFSEVLEHLPIESVYPTLNEIWRVLDKQGYLIVTSPNQARLLNRIKLLLGKSILELPAPLEYAGGTFGHIRLYTSDEIKVMLTSMGFEVQQIIISSRYSEYTYDKNLTKRLVYNILWMIEIMSRTITDKLGDSWYVLCQKP